jgi:hypothetical protein
MFYDEKDAPIQFQPVFTFPYGNGSNLFINSDGTGYICMVKDILTYRGRCIAAQRIPM